jgi:hypothetical protein
MFKVGSVALLHHGGFPPPQDDADKEFLATLATVRFSDPTSVGQAYRKLSELPFFEGA